MSKIVDNLMICYIQLAVQNADIFHLTRYKYWQELIEQTPNILSGIDSTKREFCETSNIFNYLWDTNPSFREQCNLASIAVASVLKSVQTERMRQEGRLD
ncbi:MAG: hypothetical protein ABH822_01210 [Patescibacteria group bacterium]